MQPGIGCEIPRIPGLREAAGRGAVTELELPGSRKSISIHPGPKLSIPSGTCGTVGLSADGIRPNVADTMLILVDWVI